MTASDGRAAAELQPAVGAVEQRLSRGFAIEAAGLAAVVIMENGGIWNARRGAPERCLFPVIANVRRSNEDDKRFRPSRCAGDEFREFGEACARAVALRMRQHHQR